MNRTIHNPVIKDTTTFIRLAAETENSCTEVAVTLMPGGGTPMHFHTTYSETFLVTSGALHITPGNKTEMTLQAGMSHTVAAGAHHRFLNATDQPVTFNVLIQPGSGGFEKALCILYGLATDGLTNNKAVPRNWKHLAVVMAISDMNVSGLLSLASPFFRWYANTPGGKSVARYLYNKYCRDIYPEKQPHTTR